MRAVRVGDGDPLEARGRQGPRRRARSDRGLRQPVDGHVRTQCEVVAGVGDPEVRRAVRAGTGGHVLPVQPDHRQRQLGDEGARSRRGRTGPGRCRCRCGPRARPASGGWPPGRRSRAAWGRAGRSRPARTTTGRWRGPSPAGVVAGGSVVATVGGEVGVVATGVVATGVVAGGAGVDEGRASVAVVSPSPPPPEDEQPAAEHDHARTAAPTSRHAHGPRCNDAAGRDSPARSAATVRAPVGQDLRDPPVFREVLPVGSTRLRPTGSELRQRADLGPRERRCRCEHVSARSGRTSGARGVDDGAGRSVGMAGRF